MDPAAIPEQDVCELLPLIHDGLDLKIIQREQGDEYPELWAKGEDPEEEEYHIIRGVLYSTRHPRPTAAEYPRLVLPSLPPLGGHH